jgi:hypothetical protein
VHIEIVRFCWLNPRREFDTPLLTTRDLQGLSPGNTIGIYVSAGVHACPRTTRDTHALTLCTQHKHTISFCVLFRQTPSFCLLLRHAICFRLLCLFGCVGVQAVM